MNKPKSTTKRRSSKASAKDLNALALAKQWARVQERTESIKNKGCNHDELSQYNEM